MMPTAWGTDVLEIEPNAPAQMGLEPSDLWGGWPEFREM